MKSLYFKRFAASSLAIAAIGGSVTYHYVYHSSRRPQLQSTRFLVAFSTVLRIAMDYKRNAVTDNDDVMSDLHARNAQLLRQSLQRLGGIYVKLGQHLHSSRHLVPDEYADAMLPLLSANPTSSWLAARRVIDQSFGETFLEENFRVFDRQPIASASLAQVYRAITWRGDAVALKVQHCGLVEQSLIDTHTIATLTALIAHYFPTFSYTWMVREMTRGLPTELNFVHERENQERARALLGLSRSALSVGPLFDTLNDQQQQQQQQEEEEEEQKQNYDQRRRVNHWVNRSTTPVQRFFLQILGIRLLFDVSNSSEEIDNAYDIASSKYVSSKNVVEHSHYFYVPEVVAPTSERVLITELIADAQHVGAFAATHSPRQCQKVFRRIVDLYSAMMFSPSVGFLHLDPHPDNLLIRRTRGNQIVLLDHGLYRNFDVHFTRRFVSLWLALSRGDEVSFEQHAAALGITNHRLLASVLTARASNEAFDATRLHFEGSLSDEKRHSIRREAQKKIQDISILLSEADPTLLLFFKTNDLLRELHASLSPSTPLYLNIIARCALYTATDGDGDELMTPMTARLARLIGRRLLRLLALYEDYVL